MKAQANSLREAAWPAALAKTADYIELTKPRISLMVLVATLAGAYMAASGALDLALVFHALLGTALVGGGASALN